MKIGNYEFTLKNFQHLESRSDETECFSATLYVNGKKFAECGNGGHGAPTDIRVFPECKGLAQEIEVFLKTQPKVKLEGCDFELDRDMELIVDTLLQKLLDEKEMRKIKAKTKKSLVFRKPDGDHIVVSWKNQTIATMIAVTGGSEALKKVIVKEVTAGNVLINDNIPTILLPKETNKK